MKNLKYIYISTFLFWLATNIFSPFLSIFAITQLKDVGVTEIGLASTMFFLAFGMSVMFFANLTDRVKGLKDDFVVTFGGFIARGIVLMMFAIAMDVSQFLLIHFLLGFTRGLTDSSQEKIIAKLTSSENLSTSFGFKTGIVNLAAALGAGIGGYFVDLLGFRIVMASVGVITIFAGIIFYQNRKVIS